MNKKTKAALKAVAAGAGFAVAIGDVVDNFAKTTNHPAWYTHYPVSNLVTLNFGERENKNGGGLHSLGALDPLNGALKDVLFASPTDARIGLVLTNPVVRGQPNEILDKAAALILQQIRSVATTTAPYTKDDIKVLLINARAVVAAYSIARRASGNFNITDAYDADAYFKYLMIGSPWSSSYANMAANMASFRAQLGAITPLIRNLIPLNIDLMERTKWLFSNIFADSPSAKFSTKQFVCQDFPMLAEDGTPHMFSFQTNTYMVAGKGTSADPFVQDTTNCHTTATFEDVPKTVRAMIEFMTNQTMTSRILGDILKAFGETAFMEFPALDPTARTPIVYDEDVLQQIQNLTYGPCNYFTDLKMYGSCIFPQKNVGTVLLNKHVVNTYRDVVPVGKLLSLTRLSAFARADSGYFRKFPLDGGTAIATKLLKYVACGTEVVASYSWLRSTGPSETMVIDTPTSGFVDDVDAQTTRWVTSEWSQDDYAPAVLVAGDTSATSAQIMLDAQNWAIMGAEDMSVYTEYASLSLMMIHELVHKSDTFVFVN